MAKLSEVLPVEQRDHISLRNAKAATVLALLLRAAVWLPDGSVVEITEELPRGLDRGKKVIDMAWNYDPDKQKVRFPLQDQGVWQIQDSRYSWGWYKVGSAVSGL